MLREYKNTEDKTNKLYNKVLMYYNRGKLQKALDLCYHKEDLIINSLALLNLKGLMHYLKGEMNEARRCWNLSYRNFSDPISEKYLMDSVNDEELWKSYVRGVKYSKALNITEAIYELEQCKMKSHFNCINVNNQLTQCYLKKTNYDEAILCINEVLSIDSDNKEANDNRKNLIDLDVIENKTKKIIIKSFIVSIVLIGIISCYFIFIRPLISNKAKVETPMSSKEQVDKLQDELNKNTNKDSPQKERPIDKDNNEKLHINKMGDLVEKKDFKGIDDELDKWSLKKDALSVNESIMFNKGKSFMDSNGGEYFYKKGFEFSKSGNYKSAIEYYNIGLKYGIGKFPYEHSLYMLGVAYNKSNDYQNSIKIFEKYYIEYKEKTYIKDGNYIEDALRYLINMTKNIDDEKYQKYSLELKGVT